MDVQTRRQVTAISVKIPCIVKPLNDERQSRKGVTNFQKRDSKTCASGREFYPAADRIRSIRRAGSPQRQHAVEVQLIGGLQQSGLFRPCGRFTPRPTASSVTDAAVRKNVRSPNFGVSLKSRTGRSALTFLSETSHAMAVFLVAELIDQLEIDRLPPGEDAAVRDFLQAARCPCRAVLCTMIAEPGVGILHQRIQSGARGPRAGRLDSRSARP